jgi:cell shape-determining protein MreD
MSLSRVTLVLLWIAALYTAVAYEAMEQRRTLRPHLPAALVVMAVWSVAMPPAVVMAGLVGAAVDATSVHPAGMGLLTAVLMAAPAHALKQKGKYQSPLACTLFSVALGVALIGGFNLLPLAFSERPVDPTMVRLAIARGISTGLAGATAVLCGRLIAQMVGRGTRMLLGT